MSAREGLAFFNVAPSGVTETTLAAEAEARRFGTVRGYCVEARSESDAFLVIRDYGFQQRGYPVTERGRVVVTERQKVPVLSREAV